MTYLDILREAGKGVGPLGQPKSRLLPDKPLDIGPRCDEINELNEKRGVRLSAGKIVVWDSPLFGRCSGEVVLALTGGWLVVRSHRVTGQLAFVNIARLVRA